MNANIIIDSLGGTAEVARLCRVKQPSVSQWRKEGIPGYRIDFLRLARPEVFSKIEEELSGRTGADR